MTFTSILSTLKHWAKSLRLEVQVMVGALSDKRVPVLARLVIVLVIAYALSPIDLIPDFIPVIGYLDDLLIVPAGLALARWLIPLDVLHEHRQSLGASPSGWLPTLGLILVAAAWTAIAAVVLLQLGVFA